MLESLQVDFLLPDLIFWQKTNVLSLNILLIHPVSTYLRLLKLHKLTTYPHYISRKKKYMVKVVFRAFAVAN